MEFVRTQIRQFRVLADSETEALSKPVDSHNLMFSQDTIAVFGGGTVVVREERWPSVLVPLKLLAKPGDRGAGDIIARIIGPIGGESFKVWYKELFGQDCGCGDRQDMLNERWPLLGK